MPEPSHSPPRSTGAADRTEVVVVAKPNHLLTDPLMAAAETLQEVSMDQSTEQGRLTSAAWWLKGLDERGFILVADPRKAQ